MQRHFMRVCLFLIFTTLIVGSAYAANETVNSYIIHDQPYTPYPVFILTLGIGIMFLIMSLVLSNEQNNEAFAALAIIPLFAASWMANQLDFTQGGLAGTATESVFRVDHNIYPATILALVIFGLGCIAVYQLYRLITANRADADYYVDPDGE